MWIFCSTVYWSFLNYFIAVTIARGVSTISLRILDKKQKNKKTFVNNTT